MWLVMGGEESGRGGIRLLVVDARVVSSLVVVVLLLSLSSEINRLLSELDIKNTSNYLH